MAVLCSSASPPRIFNFGPITFPNFYCYPNSENLLHRPPSSYRSGQLLLRPIAAVTPAFAPPHRIDDKSSLIISETAVEDELWAAARLRVRSFYDFQRPSYGIEDHRMYLAEREFEALKERLAGKTTGFRRVSCINATLPLSQLSNMFDDLCAECKFTNDGEDRVVVGTLDISQCMSLPDEIAGKKPELFMNRRNKGLKVLFQQIQGKPKQNCLNNNFLLYNEELQHGEGILELTNTIPKTTRLFN